MLVIGFLNKYINILFAIMFGLILIVVILLGGFVDYSYKRYLPFFFNISFSLLITYSVLRVSRAIINNRRNIYSKINNANIDKIVILVSVGLFFYHMILLAVVGVVSITDAGLVEVDANLIANGDVSNLNNEYFSRYPNNLLITLIQSVIIKFNNFLGLFDNGLVIIVIINSTICIATLLMMYSIIKRFLGDKYAFVGFIIGAILFGISPWVLTSYSDPIGLLFPTLLLYVYLINPERKVNSLLKYVMIIVIASIGYSIKPQTFVMFIAIIIFESAKLVQTRKVLLIVPLVVSSVFCLSTVQNGIISAAESVGYVIDEEQAFGIQHWFMMGLNDEYDGGYADEDANFSASFDNSEDRNKANMQEAKNRLKEMGVVGTTIHMTKKLLMNFNDGTFTLYLVIVRDLFVFGRALIIIEQICWILILGMCFASAMTKFKNTNHKEFDEEKKNFTSLIMLSIIGLTMFVMLFEGRARYLYTFAPIFTIMATFGVKSIFERISENDQFIGNYKGRKTGCILSVGSATFTIIAVSIVAVIFLNSYLSGFVVDTVNKHPNLLKYGTLEDLTNILEVIVILAVIAVVLLNIVTSVFTLLYFRLGKYKEKSGILNLVALSPFSIIAGILILECEE